MKTSHLFLAIPIIVICLASCDYGEIDTEKPTIDLTAQEAFPLNGDTIYFGESFHVKVRFSDNVELGSYSIDIHNNFDHHSHSTEVTEVTLDPVKPPVNPYTFIDNYTIPTESQTYETDLEIVVPENNSNGMYDDGDYHFMIQLTDKNGWSTNKGLSIKMMHRHS